MSKYELSIAKWTNLYIYSQDLCKNPVLLF